MPSEDIYCKDCAAKKREIEESGACKVISCKPLPGQQQVAESQRRCRIVWELKPL